MELDDLTLDAIEHSLDASLTYDRPDDAADDDQGPWVTGADFTLSKLLDFIGGTMGEDPAAEVLDPGREVSDDAPFWEKVAAAKVILDSRIHYTEHDLIRDLVAEVRRGRAITARAEALRDNWVRLAGEAMDPECREWLTAASASLRAALATTPPTDAAEAAGGADHG